MEKQYEAHLQHVKARRENLGSQLCRLFTSETEALSLEIGCGHGHWLVDFASAHPEKRFLGVDIIGDRVERAKRKKERAGLRNVEFLRGEAMEILDLLPSHVVLRDTFILFPDPWPKKRHWKNRLFGKPFLEALSERSEAGARCYFRTDDRNYFDWAVEAVALQSLWRREETFEWPFERETVFQARAAAYYSLAIVKE